MIIIPKEGRGDAILSFREGEYVDKREVGPSPGGDSAAEGGVRQKFGSFSAYLAFGFGMHWSWVYATTIDSQRIFFGSAHPQSSLVFYIISLVFLVLTSAGLGFWSMRRNRFSPEAAPARYRGLIVAATFLTVLGTAALPFSDLGTWQTTVVLVYAGSCTGIGSSILLVLWGQAYGRVESKTVVLNSSIGIAFAFGLYVLIAHLPIPVSIAVSSLLPIPEALLLAVVLSRRSAQIPMAFNKRNFQQGRYLIRLGFPVLAFGFSLGILRELSIRQVAQTMGETGQVFMLMAALLALVIIVIPILVLKKPEKGFFYRPMFLATLISVALLPVSAVSPAANSIVLLVSYICFEVLLWSALSEQAYELKIPAIMVFGFGKALLSVGTLIGAANLKASANLSSSFAFGSTAFILLLVTTMVVAYCLWPQEKDIQKTDAPVRDKAAPSLEDSKSIDIGNTCALLADCHMLSVREAEVLYLLARGRNATFIAGELFISANTAKSHIRHVYQKLEIHSQQALIDLVESGRSVKEEGTGVLDQ